MPVSADPPGELKAGTSVKLQCQVNSLIPGSTLQWTRPDGTTATESGTYELPSVASSHAGPWNCIINPGGQRYSLELVVNGGTLISMLHLQKPLRDHREEPHVLCFVFRHSSDNNYTFLYPTLQGKP